MICITNEKPRVSRHNGRAGKNGIYNPKHNDRSFDIANAENIDTARTAFNLYWDCRNGLRTHEEHISGGYPTFKQIEHDFYAERYSDYIAGQTQRNNKAGHAKRNRTIDDLLQDKRFCPEETLYQIGKEGDCPPPEVLTSIVQEFMATMQQRFGEHVHILDWALHLDETSPHIHARQVFDIENRYGEWEPKQEKALEQLGIPLPHPDNKPSKTNNRKVSFDAACRNHLLTICKQHGLDVAEDAIYGGKEHLEKNDYVIAAQQQKLAEQETELAEKEQELTEKQERLDDTDALLDAVSDATYSEAINVMAATVTTEVQKQNWEVIRGMIVDASAADSSLRKAERTAVMTWLTQVKNRLKDTTKQLVQKVVAALDKPDMRRAVKAKIKERAAPSIRELLNNFKNRQHGDKQKTKQELSSER